MSHCEDSLEMISPPSSPSNEEVRMRRRMEKLKEETTAAGARFKALKVSGTKEESRAAYDAYQARVDDYRRARKEYEGSYGVGGVGMEEIPEIAGGSTAVGSKSGGPVSPSTSKTDVAKPADAFLEKGKMSVKTVEGSKQQPISAVLKTPMGVEAPKVKTEVSKVSGFLFQPPRR